MTVTKATVRTQYKYTNEHNNYYESASVKTMGNSESALSRDRTREVAQPSHHPDNKGRQEKLIDGAGEPLSVEMIMKVSRAVCKLTVNNGTGSGFLGKFLQRDTGQYVFGLFTNNHVLNEESLAEGNAILLSFDSFEADNVKKKTLNIDVDYLFRFTCPLLDVSFVELSKEQVDALRQLNCNFLLLSANWKGSKEEKLFILQYPGAWF